MIESATCPGLIRWLWSAVALCATACINVDGQFGSPIPEEKVASIQDGATTRDEVREWFGPPSAFFRPSLLDLIFDDDEALEAASGAPITEDVYTWRFVQSELSIFFVPILFAIADTETRSTTLSVFFDENGVVRYHAFRRDGPLGEEP